MSNIIISMLTAFLVSFTGCEVTNTESDPEDNLPEYHRISGSGDQSE